MGYSTDIRERNIVLNLLKMVKSEIAVLRMCRFLKREKIDIVHNNSLLVWAGMEAARRSGVKYICHVRELVWEDHHIKLIHEARQYKLMENADMTIFISEFVKKTFTSRYKIKNYVTIKDGFQTERYIEDKHVPLYTQDGIKVLIAGRIAAGKGQMDAVKAIGYLNVSKKLKCDLLVVGPVRDQQYMDDMAKYIEENNLSDSITFKPFCDLKEIRAASDIELVCSIAEGLGRVTVESMLSGCITIGANAGATPELITDGVTGYLYNTGDYMDLARVIILAVKNKENGTKMQKKAISECITNFDLEKYAMTVECKYAEIIAQKGTM